MATERFLLTPDGLRLFYRRWEASGAKAFCFIVHGLGEHGGRYERVARFLTSRGFTVFAMDHRGHGRSEGRRGDCRSVDDFVEDLHQLLEQAWSERSELPRILIGHSLGGLISLIYAVQHSQMIRAVAVSSPALGLALQLPKLKVAAAKTLARILPITPISNGVTPEYLSRDSETVRNYQKDPLVHHVLTARCAVAIQRAMDQSPSLAPNLKVPCLILQAGQDRICDPQASLQFSMAVQNAPVTFHRYDDLYHELFNEPERDQVMQDLCRWMDEVLR